MKYFHVDVFSDKPLSGNGLTVVFPENPLSAEQMLSIAREFRQFETIFIFEKDANGAYPVRIFTMDEELMFAGHPIVGAGAVLHRLFHPLENAIDICLDLSGRTVMVSSSVRNRAYSVTMNQGIPKFIRQVEKSHHGDIAKALGLDFGDIHETWPVEVVSTGLPYLLVPLKQGISRARISTSGFESFLSRFGAKFVYVFDAVSLECRTWDNQGTTEDVATGSAAGPLCAYLVNNGFAKRNEIISIHQGRYVHRPSVIKTWTSDTKEIFIQGDVAFFAAGELKVG